MIFRNGAIWNLRLRFCSLDQLLTIVSGKFPAVSAPSEMEDTVTTANERDVSASNITCSDVTVNYSVCNRTFAESDEEYVYDYDTSLAAVHIYLVLRLLDPFLFLLCIYAFNLFSCHFPLFRSCSVSFSSPVPVGSSVFLPVTMTMG